MVARRKTLQNSNDDYPKIVDFISRFAVHHINVNFSCRKVNIPAFPPHYIIIRFNKAPFISSLVRFIGYHLLLMSQHGANRADVRSSSTSSRLDAIRNIYGASVVRDLIEIEVSDEDAGDAVFKMDGYISNANYVAKKIMMILFINGRNIRE